MTRPSDEEVFGEGDDDDVFKEEEEEDDDGHHPNDEPGHRPQYSDEVDGVFTGGRGHEGEVLTFGDFDQHQPPVPLSLSPSTSSSSCPIYYSSHAMHSCFVSKSSPLIFACPKLTSITYLLSYFPPVVCLRSCTGHPRAS